MILRNIILLLSIINYLQPISYAKAQSPYNLIQSPCYLVIVGSEKEELYRVNGPSLQTSREGNTLDTFVITFFGDSTSALRNASLLDIEVKPNKSKQFHHVQFKIPDRIGCHLLLSRDTNLKPPLYFRAEWISQDMMDEYFFGNTNREFDTTLFSKLYKTSIPSPAINITYKKEPFTSELIRNVNPFNGQLIELDFDILPAKETKYTPYLKAVEISFIHPEIASIENVYVLFQIDSTLPRKDNYVFWPNDFTLVSGTKIIVRALYWYKRGYEILESGMITSSYEF